MHSPAKIPESPRAEANQAVAPDLQLVKPAPKRIAAANFRRIIVAGEIIADLLTITLAIRFTYFIYGATAIGKHLHFPEHVIWCAGAVFAAVMVLILYRL